MRYGSTCLSVVVVGIVAITCTPARAQPIHIQGCIDVDNFHVLYMGDPFGNNVTNRGNGRGPFSPVCYDLMPNNVCIYIAAWSDDYIAQGLLHDLHVNGVPIFFDDPRWSVYPTRQDRDVEWTPPEYQIEDHIVAANQSDGWLPIALGAPNDGTFLVGCGGGSGWHIPAIDSSAVWGWYDTGGMSGYPWQPFCEGYNHDEYLIFRYCWDETVPTETSTWGRIKALYE